MVAAAVPRMTGLGAVRKLPQGGRARTGFRAEGAAPTTTPQDPRMTFTDDYLAAFAQAANADLVALDSVFLPAVRVVDLLQPFKAR